MSGSFTSIWLPLYGLFYMATCLYWARVAAVENRNTETFFSAGHQLAPWMAALMMAGASISGWFLLGGAAEIAHHGFALAAVLQGGIVLALPGVFFFKRMWFIGQRLRVSSQVELFRAYYQSDFLAVVSTLVAVLFALGFAAVQMRALAHLISHLTADMISPVQAAAFLSLVLFAYVAIGGMRAVGYLGALQSIFLAAAMAGFAAYALILTGGFAALNQGLRQLASTEGGAALFAVAGVIRFSAGLGRDLTAAPDATSVASLSLAFAFMGFQASPLAAKIILSTRNANGFAAGQTWVMAGFFGGLIAFGIAIIGAAGLINPNYSLAGVLGSLLQTSPWFMAWLVIGLVAGVQLLAGLALLTAGEALVRTIYKPYFHSALSRADTVNITRIVIGLLALAAVLMQFLTPVALSALAGVVLPLAFQLWTPLLGITWLRWFTRPAVVSGVGFGMAAVLLTEPLGYHILSFLGLELPWGRWPWTLHSAAWGMAANLTAVLLISAITNRRTQGEEAADVQAFIASTLKPAARVRRLTTTAWSVVLAWMFLAAGPGLIFGNTAFANIGMPSIWAWSGLFWLLGVAMIWFLSYAMDMASPLHREIEPYSPRPRLRRDQSMQEQRRLRILIITAAAAFVLIVLVNLSFGH